MKSLCRAAGTVATLAAVAGCAPMQWQKAGSDQTTTARDLDACRKQARTVSYQELYRRVSIQPYSIGARGAMEPSIAAEGDRVALEQHFLQTCMRSQGYELTRVERAAGK